MRRLRFTNILKVMMLVVLAGGFMHSCSRRHKFVMEDEILLGARNVGTKAIVEDKQSLIDQSLAGNTGFGVFGYKSVTGKNSFLQFDNIMVEPTSSNESTSWTYSPRRYWDSDINASYQFGAYWPYLPSEEPQGGGPYVTQANKVVTFHNIPNWQESSVAKDLMTANRQGKYRPIDDAPFGQGTVNFTFEHKLANLVIKAYYIGLEDNPITVYGLRLSGENMLSTDGTANYTLPFGGQDMTAGFGTISRSATPHTLYPPTATPAHIVLPTTAFDDEVDPADYTCEPICSWLMVPCTGWQNLSLDVSYTVGEGEQSLIDSRVSGIALNTTVSEVLHEGEIFPQNTYVVTLRFDSSGGGIEVESIVVSEWDEVELNTGVYNW